MEEEAEERSVTRTEYIRNLLETRGVTRENTPENAQEYEAYRVDELKTRVEGLESRFAALEAATDSEGDWVDALWVIARKEPAGGVGRRPTGRHRVVRDYSRRVAPRRGARVRRTRER